MTATDELRRLLDERGIEHMDFNMPDKFLTMFGGGEHDGAYTENSVDTILTVYGASPENAVDATLGRGECTLINAADDLGKGTQSMMCFDCGYTALDDWWDEFNYCPNCGRKVVDE